jgi:hypothetical protein
MNSATISNWIQTITGVGIVLGLGLVIWELQQSHEAASSDLSSGYFQLQNQSLTAIMGDNAAEAIAKSCENPEALNHAELVILEHYYIDLINSIDRTKVLADRGRFYSDQVWRGLVGLLTPMLKTSPGVGYWNSIARDWVDPEILEVGDEYLKNLSRSCAEDYEDWVKETTKYRIQS